MAVITNEELEKWAKLRADDAGHLARELVVVRHMNTIEIAQKGFDAWAAKPHNKKWAKMIYHTPIPNDLVVCIAMAFSEELKRNERFPPDSLL